MYGVRTLNVYISILRRLDFSLYNRMFLCLCFCLHLRMFVCYRCPNCRTQAVVTQLRGVDAILRILSNTKDGDSIVEPSICTLRHLTSRHQDAELAQVAIRNSYGIPVLVTYLQPQYKWSLIKVCCVPGLCGRYTEIPNILWYAAGNIPKLIFLILYSAMYLCWLCGLVYRIDNVEVYVGSLCGDLWRYKFVQRCVQRNVQVQVCAGIHTWESVYRDFYRYVQVCTGNRTCEGLYRGLHRNLYSDIIVQRKLSLLFKCSLVCLCLSIVIPIKSVFLMFLVFSMFCIFPSCSCAHSNCLFHPVGCDRTGPQLSLVS